MIKHLKRFFAVLSTAMLLCITIMQTNVYAYSDIPEYFDFGDACVSINAGESYTMWFRSTYNYTYYIGDHTSKLTYVECTFHSGTEYLVFHIGPDEQVKNVFFHFYVDDEQVHSDDVHDCVEVYVQNIDKSLANTNVKTDTTSTK